MTAERARNQAGKTQTKFLMVVMGSVYGGSFQQMYQRQSQLRKNSNDILSINSFILIKFSKF